MSFSLTSGFMPFEAEIGRGALNILLIVNFFDLSNRRGEHISFLGSFFLWLVVKGHVGHFLRNYIDFLMGRKFLSINVFRQAPVVNGGVYVYGTVTVLWPLLSVLTSDLIVRFVMILLDT